MKKKVLVTGSTGFVGNYLTAYLVSKGYQVIGTYLKKKPRKNRKGIKYLPLDISSLPKTIELFKKVKPDSIIHLAAFSIPRKSWEDPASTFQVNTLGTINVLEALRRVLPKTKLVFSSSIQVYGKTFRKGAAVKETDLIWPESPYASSKAAAEMACFDYARQFKLKIVVARSFNGLGAGQSMDLVFPDWSRQIVMSERGKRKPVLEVGSLDVYRDFLNVQDVVSAYETLVRKGKAGEVYNICSGKVRLLRDYVDFLCGKASVPIRISTRKGRMRAYDSPIMKGSAAKLRRLGWRPKYSPFQAVEDILNEWRQVLKK